MFAASDYYIIKNYSAFKKIIKFQVPSAQADGNG